MRLHPFTLGELLDPGRPPGGPKVFWRQALEAAPPAGAEDALGRLERFTGFPEPLFAQDERRLRRWRGARKHLVLREDLRDLTRIRRYHVQNLSDEAKGVASRFIEEEKAGGISADPARVEEHKPDDKDGSDSWWVYFAKGQTGKRDKHKDFAIVSVDKMSREPKWITKGEPPPAPKKAKKTRKSKKKSKKH